MKTIIRLFAAVLTAVPVLVSCYSEPLPEVIPEVIPEDEGNGSEQDTTVRVITVSFDTKATRTVLGSDGFTPEFSSGDVIYVANGTGHETPEVEYKNIGGKDVATISVSLGGPLKLVYPSNCAKLGHYNEEDDTWVQNPNEIAGIIVPPEQTGYFKDANICMAEMEADDTKATFHNETAVFVIDVPDNTKYLEVTSLRTINTTTGQRYTASEDIYDKYWAGISREWNGENRYSARRTITIGDGTINIPDPCFVSIMVEEGGEVLLRDLNFDAQNSFDSSYDGLAGTMGGFSPFFLDGKFGTGSADTKKVQKGAIYSGVEDHLHGYVNFGQVRWATMNIGATSTDRSSPDSYGLYFAWGETTGHAAATNGENAFVTGFTDNSQGFSWTNAPFNGGYSTYNYSSINGQKSIVCPNGILALEYDAAYKNWGGAWRMPRNSDTLYPEGVTYKVVDYQISSSRGTVEFANVGYGQNTSRTVETSGSGAFSSYWTSTLSSKPQAAYYVSVDNIRISTGNNSTYGSRYIGHVIRPVVGKEIL